MSKAKEIASKGHNRIGGVDAEQLESIITRVENLMEDKAGIVADIRDVMSEAKGKGFDAKTIRKIIVLRAMDAEVREAEDAFLTTYQRALGMLALE